MKTKFADELDKLPGWLSVHEGQFLRKAATLMKKKRGEVVEIGSFQGKSTIWLASAAKRVYAVDPHQGKVDKGKYPPTLTAFRRNIRKFKLNKKIHLIRKTSAAAASTWKKDIKLLFIDGLHDEKNALRDFRLWSRFMVPGGIVAMHDAFCGWEGAQKVAFTRIVQNDAFCEVGVVGSIVYGIYGKSGFLSHLLRWRSRLVIALSLWLHEEKAIPSFLSFFLIHRVLKLFLLNRFTIRRG